MLCKFLRNPEHVFQGKGCETKRFQKKGLAGGTWQTSNIKVKAMKAMKAFAMPYEPASSSALMA